MKTEQVEAIRKRFRREWLFIAIDKMDRATTTPLRGRLLAHSPHRYEIDRVSIKYPKPALIVFSADTFPPGYAAAFCLHGCNPASRKRRDHRLRRIDRSQN